MIYINDKGTEKELLKMLNTVRHLNVNGCTFENFIASDHIFNIKVNGEIEYVLRYLSADGFDFMHGKNYNTEKFKLTWIERELEHILYVERNIFYENDKIKIGDFTISERGVLND